MRTTNEVPGAVAAARRDMNVVLRRHENRNPKRTSPQLCRLGDTSKKVAFVEQGDVTLGVIARISSGWSGCRTGSAECPVFPTALAAVRFVSGRAA